MNRKEELRKEVDKLYYVDAIDIYHMYQHLRQQKICKVRVYSKDEIKENFFCYDKDANDILIELLNKCKYFDVEPYDNSSNLVSVEDMRRELKWYESIIQSDFVVNVMAISIIALLITGLFQVITWIF